ncbi:uncharacterized protein LOC141655228 [Silene latifolia]|uniref:uncharacterized protein LOC141655228 n=1 Tax=Silene latifolia TaxID=37657 RepID=UPI003D76D47B
MNLEYLQVKIRDDPLNPDLIQKEIEAFSSVRWMEKAYNDFLLQKSKDTWVELGGKNNKYFHSIIKDMNKVLRIADTKGRVCYAPKLIQTTFMDFYTFLLGFLDEVLKVSKNVVRLRRGCTTEDHLMLLAPVTNKEIKEVMFSIPNHKAADCPDGYTSASFKDSWDIMGGTMCAAIKDFFPARKDA